MDEGIQEIFNDLVGPLLPPNMSILGQKYISIFDNELNRTIAQINSQGPEQIIGVNFGIVDELSLNAVCHSIADIELIGLNAGLTILLPRYFYWLLSHPDVFPDIGDPLKEKRPSLFDDSFFKMSGKFSEISDDSALWEVRLPLDPVRKHYAVYATLIAWNFLLAHEVAHINRCHPLYLSLRSNQKDSPEGKPKPLFEFSPERKSDLRHILEIDADWTAGRLLSMGHILNGLKNSKFLALGDSDTNHLSWEWSDVYLMLARAIGILFQLISIIEIQQNIDDPSRSHPHPDARMQVLSNFLWPTWNKVITKVDEFKKLNRKAGGEIKEIFFGGILPSPLSRANRAYLADFASIVKHLFYSVQEHAEPLNKLTQERWNRKIN